MAETEKHGPGGPSWWKKLENLRHPNFRRRLEGVKDSGTVAQDSEDRHLVDRVEAEIIKMANGDENPAVRDAAFRQVLKWGGPVALGVGVAVGAAILGAKAWNEQRDQSKEEIEKILQNPAAHGTKRALRVAEEAVRLGKGSCFVENLLGSFGNSEINLKVRRDLLAAINPHSSLGAELYRNESMVTATLDGLPPEIADRLRKLLKQAKKIHSEKDKLRSLDLKKLH